MKISFGKPEDVPALKRLWQMVFGDSMEYIDFFFEKCYPYCRSVVAKADDQVVAMLFLLPSFALIQQGDTIQSEKASYIYAVATHTDFRRRGISGQLLSFTHEMLNKEGNSFCYLRPAEESLFEFYHRYGFCPQFGSETLPLALFLEPQKLESPSPALHEYPLDRLLPLRKEMGGELVMCWGEDILHYIEDELRLGEGKVLCLDRQQGYLVAYKNQEGYEIKEWAVRNQADQQALFYGAVLALQGKITIRMPSEKPLGMAYWYTEKPKTNLKNCNMGLVLD